ncbi:MAG TPA: hypothetical protein VF041_20780 [Gemmatimonadaceae bacterium]
MPIRRAACFIAMAALLAACSKSESSTKGDAAPAAAASAAPAEGTPNSTIHLVVTGGPNAGTYDAQATSGGCSYGLAGTNAWGNQFSIDTNDPKAFSSLQLIVPNSKAAAGGTEHFRMTVGFGPIMGMTSYDIDTRTDAGKPQGKGKLTVDDRGGSGKVTFSAETAEGVKLDGTIDCHTVMRVS